VRSEAGSVEQFLSELPEERRSIIAAVRAVVLANLPSGIVETMNWGMISYEVPLDIVPDTYNGQPLSYAGLASQKQHCALYLMSVYGSDDVRREFESAYESSGKKMNIGKSCVRFRRLEDLPLDVVAKAVAAVSLEQFIAMHERSQSLRKSRRSTSTSKQG